MPSPSSQPIFIGLSNGKGRLIVYPETPLRIDTSEFRFDSIPYGASWLNRFGGQIGLYSVAQHEVLLSRIVGDHPGHRLAALLHDTAEGLGAGDTNTFLKRTLSADSRLGEYEDAVCEAIWGWCGLPDTYATYMVAVHPIDKALGTEEARQAGLTIPAGAPELSVAACRKVDLSHRWVPSLAATLWTLEWDQAAREWGVG